MLLFQWNKSEQSTVIFNIGSKPFHWSSLFIATYKRIHGQECPDYLPLNERIDNDKCIKCIDEIGIQASGSVENNCILSVALVNKDAAKYGVVIDVQDGVETVYIDTNMYIVKKMSANYFTSSMTPNACVNFLMAQATSHIKDMLIVS
jgi:hypothetical protein